MSNLSTNICKTNEFEDSIFYHSVCGCSSSDHCHEIMLEVDKDGYYIACTIYQDLFWMERGMCDTWYKSLWFRVRNSVKYLFTGHVRMSGEHIFQKEQHMKDYANALLNGVDRLNEKTRKT